MFLEWFLIILPFHALPNCLNRYIVCHQLRVHADASSQPFLSELIPINAEEFLTNLNEKGNLLLYGFLFFWNLISTGS